MPVTEDLGTVSITQLLQDGYTGQTPCLLVHRKIRNPRAGGSEGIEAIQLGKSKSPSHVEPHFFNRHMAKPLLHRPPGHTYQFFGSP